MKDILKQFFRNTNSSDLRNVMIAIAFFIALIIGTITSIFFQQIMLTLVLIPIIIATGTFLGILIYQLYEYGSSWFDYFSVILPTIITFAILLIIIDAGYELYMSSRTSFYIVVGIISISVVVFTLIYMIAKRLSHETRRR